MNSFANEALRVVREAARVCSALYAPHVCSQVGASALPMKLLCAQLRTASLSDTVEVGRLTVPLSAVDLPSCNHPNTEP